MYVSRNADNFKAYVSAAYIFCFVGMAFHVAVLGPTLPALAVVYGQDSITGLSLGLIGKSVGGFLGVLCMGKVLARYPGRGNLIMFTLSILSGVCTSLVPHFSFRLKGATSVALFSVILLVQGFFQQMWDVGGNILLTKTWPNKKLLMPWMNLLHFSWGVGATICPLLAASIGITSTRLPLLYLTIGFIGVVTTIPLLFLESPLEIESNDLENNDSNKATTSSSEEITLETDVCATNIKAVELELTEDSEREDIRTNQSILRNGLIAMFLFYFSYAGIEQTFGSWLASYVYLTGNTIEDGAFAVSILWGSLTMGRLLASFISKFKRATPERLIAIDIMFGTISTIILLAVSSSKILFMLYLSSALIGLSLASMYPMGVAFASSKLSDSSEFTSKYISGASFGGLIWPPFVGMLLSANPLTMPAVGLVLFAVCLASMVKLVYFTPTLRYTGSRQKSERQL